MTSKNKTSIKKYPYWFYVVLFLIPVLLLVLIETGLRYFNYGKEYSTFVEISEQFKNILFFNPKLPQKYFSSSVPVPSVIPDGFDKVKKDNSFRIFVLGESSAAGFPYPPNASFPRFLKRKLQMIYPANKIEVINLGVSAVNTIFIRDILDDVIEQKPDLILFYAGHNEYYGAYGSASNDLSSSSPFFARLSLYLKDYKVYQLLINTVDWFKKIISSSPQSENNKTLMAAMAGEQLVEKDSELFTKGIQQFSENYNYILSECKKNNINILTASLTSNLQHQPLVSLTKKNHKSKTLFAEAKKEFSNNNYDKAKNLFLEAKDNDAVMFRAPENINKIIYELTAKYNLTLVRIDSVFESKSKNGITGFDLFVDHLHPDIDGYKLMADEFCKVIMDKKYFNAAVNNFNKVDEIEKVLNYEFPFSRLDSTYSQIKIDVLLNSYPFKENFDVRSYFRNLKLENIADTFAVKAAAGEISWEDAHLKLAEHYFSKNDFVTFYKEINVLMEDKSFDKYPFVFAVEKLLSIKEDKLYKTILLKLFKNSPDKYSAKKLGLIFLEEDKIPTSIRFYNEALKFDNKDSEIYFNLSKAYFKIRDLTNAFLNIKKCLELSPNNISARNIYEVLLSAQTIKKN